MNEPFSRTFFGHMKIVFIMLICSSFSSNAFKLFGIHSYHDDKYDSILNCDHFF